MKKTKKLFALLLAVVMMMGLSLTTFAAEINIGNAVEGQTYNAYKLFDVTTSVSGDKTNYSYYLQASETDLKTLLEGAGLKFTAAADGSRYYVTEGLDDETDAAALAKYLNSHLDSLDDPAGTTTGTASGTATINGLDEGYYFVTTTTGSLCILNTTGAADIKEKNEEPTVVKEVTDSDPNSAEIGDAVNYKITITAQPGAENYVLHDEMSDGLTLNAESIDVQVNGEDLNSEYYTIRTVEFSDDCDFEIEFNQTYLNTITSKTEIVITYSAVLNDKAQVGTNPNTNEAILNYGEKNNVTSEPGKTNTYTYDFSLTKIDKESRQMLKDAEFALYAQETGGEKIPVIKISDGQYRVATDTEIQNKEATTVIAVSDNGTATVSGLAGKTYWLEETKAPDGYNMLTERRAVTFNTNADPAIADFTNIIVENQAGSLLPSTGGMGTTLIYIAGAVLVIGAGILLVVRRRMNAEQ